LMPAPARRARSDPFHNNYFPSPQRAVRAAALSFSVPRCS
jgi:hypothetical protein